VKVSEADNEVLAVPGKPQFTTIAKTLGKDCGNLHRKISLSLMHQPAPHDLHSLGGTCAIGVRMDVLGRDLDDIDLTIEFDPVTCAWQSLGETNDVRLSEEEGEIILTLKDLGKSKVSTIAKEIHKDRSNTSRRCAALWVKGKVKKEEIEGP
jgi:hypothetical protein